MTDITLSKLPPELAAKWKHMTERHITREYRTDTFTEHECRLIEAALRLSAGADWVLVPREPTDEMVRAGVRVWDTPPADPYQLGVARATYRAMLAAAPRHEPGEG